MTRRRPPRHSGVPGRQAWLWGVGEQLLAIIWVGRKSLYSSLGTVQQAARDSSSKERACMCKGEPVAINQGRACSACGLWLVLGARGARGRSVEVLGKNVDFFFFLIVLL